MIDFHEFRNIGKLVHLDGNFEFSPAQTGLVELRTQLDQEQHRGLGVRTTMAHLGKASNLLQQLH